MVGTEHDYYRLTTTYPVGFFYSTNIPQYVQKKNIHKTFARVFFGVCFNTLFLVFFSPYTSRKIDKSRSFYMDLQNTCYNFCILAAFVRIFGKTANGQAK